MQSIDESFTRRLNVRIYKFTRITILHIVDMLKELVGVSNHTCYIYIYIGLYQVIRAHITCLCFIFLEPKAREIYNTDRLYEPVLPV